MTEEVNATPVETTTEAPSTEVNNTDTGSVSEPSSSETSTETQAEAKQERMLSEKEVKRIAAKEKRSGYESGRRAALEELQRQQAQPEPSPAPEYQSSMGGMPQMSEDQIRQMIQQEAMKMSNLAMAQKIEQNFLSKVEQARQKYEDFDDKYEALGIEKHPQLILWMDSLDNVGDIVYDMASNPEKVANIMMLANSGFPHLAQRKLADLSASIKQNESAKKQPTAPAPLSQISPSGISADSGLSSVSDFRKASWLRG